MGKGWIDSQNQKDDLYVEPFFNNEALHAIYILYNVTILTLAITNQMMSFLKAQLKICHLKVRINEYGSVIIQFNTSQVGKITHRLLDQV